MIVLVAFLAGYQAGLLDMRSKGGRARGIVLSKKHLSDIGRMGGKARAASMSSDELREAARKAVNKRWSDVRAKAAA